MSTQQTNLGFAPYLAHVRHRLLALFGPQRDTPHADPLDVMMLAMVSSRTTDDVAAAAYARLRIRYPSWGDVARATTDDMMERIGTVTHAESKALFIPQALRSLRARSGGLSLDFLDGWPLDAAMAWLDALPGVGPKIAATALNFSRMRKRLLSVDTHLIRVGERLGLTPDGSSFSRAFESYMNIVPSDWDGDDLYEFHWLLKMLGQQICTTNHARCGACPLTDLCQHAGLRARDDLPIDLQAA